MLAFVAYLPSLGSAFVNWDDGLYIYDNPMMGAIDLSFIKWAFTTNDAANWHPLTWISYSLDYTVGGKDPFVYHLTNVILHAANAALVLVLTIMLARIAGLPGLRSMIAAVVAAALFAIHPLHVESVAWVSERKDVLYGLFFLSSLIFYLRYNESFNSRRKLFYAISIVLFTLALMSKPMAMTLPLVLLILDYYPLERIKGLKHDISALLYAKIPFFVISVFSATATIIAQDDSGAMVPLEVTPLPARLLVAVKSYVFYLWKLIWPSGLAPFYPYPGVEEVYGFEYISAAILFVAISALCLYRSKILASVWIYFILTLIPVIGLVHVGAQSAADRYMYLPSLGFFILAGAALAFFYARLHARALKNMTAATALLAFGALLVLTVNQQRVWKDSVSLWTHEIGLFPSLPKAYLYRGSAFQSSGEYAAAVEDLKRAISLNPLYSKAYNELGIVYGVQGRLDDSVQEFSRAISLDPFFDRAYNNRGFTYYKAGKFDLAIDDFNRAVKADPKNGGAYYNMAMAYMKAGDQAKADISLRQARALGVAEPLRSE